MDLLLQTSQDTAFRAARLVKAACRRRPLLVWALPAATLPVSGLDVAAAQHILYTIRRSLPEDEQAVVQSWLHALQLAQVASDRLLQALSITQRHLHFWQARLKEGSHDSFLLLSRGPGGFAAGVLERLGVCRKQQQQQQQQGAHSTLSASDRIEERIIALQMLSTQLAEALAAVHKAAEGLRLSSISWHKQQPQQALQQDVLAAVAKSMQTQAAALEQLLAAATQLHERDSAVRQLTAPALPASPTRDTRQQQQQPGVASLQQVQQQCHSLAHLLHVSSEDLTSLHSADAGAALGAASRLAAQSGPFTDVPRWAAMPSTLQRHWIRYTLAAGVSVYAGLFLYRNSRLAGSPNLDNWVAAGVAAVDGAWANHVVAPLVTVRDELFRTFRERPSIVSSAEFEADKASLLRMVADFQRDHPQILTSTSSASTTSTSNTSSSDTAGVAPALFTGEEPDIISIDAINKGMQVVMQCYESDLKKPIRGLVSGELARTLLIQVQRLKLDTEAAMLELDQILRANELSISLVAAVPALLLSWTLLRGLWRLLLVRAPPDARREATPCRLAMAELERALSALNALEHVGGSSTLAVRSAAAAAGTGQPAAAAEGMVLYKLYKVYREAQGLYRLKDSTSRYSDWPHLSADLLAMVEPSLAPAAKLDLHNRMLRTYCVLQP